MKELYKKIGHYGAVLISLMFILIMYSCTKDDEPKNNGTPTPSPTTPARIDIAATENTKPVLLSGENKTTVTFSATQDWTAKAATVTEPNDWLSVSPTSGKAGSATITIAVKANEKDEERSGTVTINCGTVSQTINVTQKAYDVFELSPEKAEIDAKGGTFSVTVHYTKNYQISSMPEWISEATTKAVSSTEHTFTVSANLAFTERSGVIVFCNDAGVCVPFNVVQAAAVPVSVDWNKDFVHKSLVMRFTATWCGWCPRMAKSIEKAKEIIPGKLESVNIHGGESALQFSGANELMGNYLSIWAFPTSVVDGRRLVDNNEIDYTANLIKNYVEETEENYPVSTSFAASSLFIGNELNVQLSVFAKLNNYYKLTVMLLEDGIVGEQADYEDEPHSDYVHNSIARIAVTNVLGDEFSTESSNSRKDFSFKVSVPDEYVKENLRILIYTQRGFGSQVKLTDSDGVYYYVDNCASVKVGESLEPALK
ncbi:MAG: Omp28-related outer membrane protein [Bacteroidaceae bacterium]|nr:Omp28-related outer membrane protein [Bacteroidaceae bacterium]